jgi:hypothetical protein
MFLVGTEWRERGYGLRALLFVLILIIRVSLVRGSFLLTNSSQSSMLLQTEEKKTQYRGGGWPKVRLRLKDLRLNTPEQKD